MNLYNFLQTGGFPMDVNVLDNMQKAYQLFNGLGALAGDLSIIKGCEQTGNTVGNGVVYINGEVLEFRSGIVSDNVVIAEEPANSTFENGQIKPTHYVRYATFGVATTSYPWSSFKRAFPTKDIAGALENKVDASIVTALAERIIDLETKMATIAEGAEVNVNTDWNATSGDAELLNKPTLASPFLHIGSVAITDWSSDTMVTVSIPDVGTSNYMVLGSIVSESIDYNDDNDVIFAIKNKTATYFKLCLREVAGNVQHISFNYVLIPF